MSHKENNYLLNSESRFYLIRNMLRKNTKFLIDCGFGSGKTLLDIHKIHPNIKLVGLDIRPTPLKGIITKKVNFNQFNVKKNRNIKLCQKADTILIMDVLEHIYDPESFLNKLNAILKKNTKVIISVPNFCSIRMLLAYFRGRIEKKEFGYFDKTHIHWFGPKDIPELTKNYFKLIKTEFVYSRAIKFKFIQMIYPKRFCSQIIHEFIKIDEHKN